MEEQYKYLVCVRCMTYNHAPYITDALNGFTMQQTTFPFVCTIVDDASTDGEQEVIHNYLEDHFEMEDQSFVRNEVTDDYRLTFARHKTNHNCFFAVLYLKYNHYSIKKSKMPYLAEWNDNAKYIALCEGDDYWIDSKKLQLQVDFLESHPSHSLCIHAYRHDLIRESGINTKIVHKYTGNKEIIPAEDVLNRTGRFSATAAMVYRKSAGDNYPDWALRAPIGDRPLKMVLFSRGHIGYLDAVLSVYREGTISSWTVKMKKDTMFRLANMKGRLQLARDFDKYTHGKYHGILKREIKSIRISIIKEYLKKYVFFSKTSTKNIHVM